MAGNKEKPELPDHDFTAKDRIWKDHCDKEKNFARHWQGTWGFMAQSYDEVIKDELPKLRNPELQKLKQNQLKQQQTEKSSDDGCIRAQPSPKPVPRTTGREIGWRSGEPSLALDKYGREARPRGSLIRQFNWPTEALP
ncbi:hypothetical protein BOX15_Mlig018155g1 [Macrostomum lignano]|uniref:Uncharacterized protein n=2 Tax=Macrostomum lignano TaxID=282301 RepID=A0A1I8IMU6_9PLAT|nr:hypothetical protein BOX15_Mlig018155g1 [Macrostomum lignano]